MTATVNWYVTFGFGGRWGGHYSVVTVRADLPRIEQEMKVRMAAFQNYGSAWAFEYPPESFDKSIGRYGMKLRETIDATAEVTS